MNEDVVYKTLNSLNIKYDIFEHPPVPTIQDALIHWKNIECTHCKNLFFRNHKGNKHFLVILEYSQQLNIRDLEQRLRQGKISFGSTKRLNKYLGLDPGSVTPFGLINDKNNEVHVFMDENLRKSERISFHPNVNTKSLRLLWTDFEKYLEWTGNTIEFRKLYD
ncbi:prolyl-tRNA synthetase associated domain-containing protein [Bacteroidota bacterium]